MNVTDTELLAALLPAMVYTKAWKVMVTGREVSALWPAHWNERCMRRTVVKAGTAVWGLRLARAELR